MCGVNLKFTNHAIERMTMRGIGASNILAIIQSADEIEVQEEGKLKYTFGDMSVVAVPAEDYYLVISVFSRSTQKSRSKTDITRGGTRKEQRAMRAKSTYAKPYIH